MNKKTYYKTLNNFLCPYCRARLDRKEDNHILEHISNYHEDFYFTCRTCGGLMKLTPKLVINIKAESMRCTAEQVPTMEALTSITQYFVEDTTDE